MAINGPAANTFQTMLTSATHPEFWGGVMEEFTNLAVSTAQAEERPVSGQTQATKSSCEEAVNDLRARAYREFGHTAAAGAATLVLGWSSIAVFAVTSAIGAKVFFGTGLVGSVGVGIDSAILGHSDLQKADQLEPTCSKLPR